MRKQQSSPPSQTKASSALITVARPAPRRGFVATLVGAIVAVVLLPVRVPILVLGAVARGVVRVGAGTGRALGAAGSGILRLPILLGRAIVAVVLMIVRVPILVLGAIARGVIRVGAGTGRALGAAGGGILRLPILLVRAILFPIVLLARTLGWMGARAVRCVGLLLLLPVKIVVAVARLLAMVARGLARALVFVLRMPFVVIRAIILGLARGTSAVAVPVAALLWGAVRFFAAGLVAVVRGFAIAVAFLGRLAGRGLLAVAMAVFVTFRTLVVGIFVCIRAVVRAAFWLALLPFRAAWLLAIGMVRGGRGLALLLVDAARTVAMGTAQLVRGLVALVRLGVRGVHAVARPVGATLATRDASLASYMPLGTLFVLGLVEYLSPGAFPFLTLGFLLLAAFASLALLSRPTNLVAVLLSWGLAVAATWRAEAFSLETSVWVDVLVYASALASLRSAYVAARSLVREAPVAWRDAEQERAHRRASRAIGIVLAVQCILFAAWSAVEGGFADAPVFGEMLLVGAGIMLALVVRTGHYIRLAEGVLMCSSVAALVGLIAAQLKAFAAGRTYTAESIGAAALMLLVATALTIVVHTRQVNG